MGCCGCTLQTSAIVAAVFGIIESLAGLIGAIIYSEGLKFSYGYYAGIRNVMISASVFNAFWLIATIILIIGIVKENAVLHRVWVGVTSVIMVVDLAHTIALVVGIVNVGSYYGGYSYNNYYYRYSSNQNAASSSYYYYTDTSQVMVFVVLMTAVSRGSIWLWIVNICLTIYTAHRANEIERGPMHTGGAVIIYPNQPVQPYPIAGQTVIVQHSGPSMGIPPSYDNQQPQYGQPQGQYGQPQYGQPQGQYGQPQGQYGQPPANQYAPDQGIPPKY